MGLVENVTPSRTSQDLGRPLKIAIHRDHIVQHNGEEQSFSARWTELAAGVGIEAQLVDVERGDLFSALRDIDGFLWRFGFDPWSLQVARRVLPAIEQGLDIPVFPSWKTCWHFEDKISQSYLMRAASIPAPETWIFWNRSEALSFCERARYPLVAKLGVGIQSNNVRMLNDECEAKDIVEQLFGAGLDTLQPPTSQAKRALRHRWQALRLILGKPLPETLQQGYFYVQEYLPDNEFDTRVTVIGNRAFAFRRFNRPGDFRASGSGRIDFEPESIDPDTIELAFDVARKLGTQSIAIDGLRRGEERVIGEMSYTYAAWALRDCPGHWIRGASGERGDLQWVPGQLRAEDAIFADFLDTVSRRRRHGRSVRVRA